MIAECDSHLMSDQLGLQISLNLNANEKTEIGPVRERIVAQ